MWGYSLSLRFMHLFVCVCVFVCVCEYECVGVCVCECIPSENTEEILRHTKLFLLPDSTIFKQRSCSAILSVRCYGIFSAVFQDKRLNFCAGNPMTNVLICILLWTLFLIIICHIINFNILSCKWVFDNYVRLSVCHSLEFTFN